MGFCEECIQRYNSCKERSEYRNSSDIYSSDVDLSDIDLSDTDLSNSDDATSVNTSDDVPFDFSKLSISRKERNDTNDKSYTSEVSDDVPFDFSQLSMSDTNENVDSVNHVSDILSDLFVSDNVRSKRKAKRDDDGNEDGDDNGGDMDDLINIFSRQKISPKRVRVSKPHKMDVENSYREKLRPSTIRKTPIQAQEERLARIQEEAKAREMRLKQKQNLKKSEKELKDFLENLSI